MDTAIRTADLFIDDGMIVSIRPRVGRAAQFHGKREGSLLHFPMVCLIDGNSARATELLAACLQDHKRACTIGQRSAGWASCQNIMDKCGRELKLTTAVFVRPDGRKLDRIRVPGHPAGEWGVTPDCGYVVNLSRRERTNLKTYFANQLRIIRHDGLSPDPTAGFSDRQRDRALAYLRSLIGQRHSPNSDRERLRGKAATQFGPASSG